MPYIELHCHSNFSFLDGAAHPEDLIARAAELGYPALALTDHSGFYGIVRFAQAARENGIRPIFGAEVTLEDNSHLVLLVKDSIGYANLSRMLSGALLTGDKGNAKVNETALCTHAEGLIALSGCMLGAVPRALLNGAIHTAEHTASRYRELFGPDSFYLELQHHNLPRHDFLCDELTRLGRKLGIPTVATNNVHYAEPRGRRLQDVLTCIKHRTTLANANGLLYPNAERYLKSPAAMATRFAHYPEAIQTTLAIAERCTFALDRLNTSLPDFPVPPDETLSGYLRRLTYEGAARRYRTLTPTVVRQLEHELRIIDKLDLAGYFLIVWDIARFCVENGILSQGRGSAANSAVCYCLGVTAVDPIKLELLFERFISEERREPPDIDIDIANNRREEVIQYVYNKYGREHAAMVCEVISYRGRSAVRDVGKALGFALDEINKLAKLLDHFSRGEELAERIAETGLNPRSRRVQLLIELCREIARFPRHLGIHVGGMIVTKRPLSEIVPIENATMKDRSVIQWDKDDAESLRFVKIDLLGLGMLSLLDIAFKLVKKHRGVTVDMAALGYGDPKVYDLLCTGETVGVFQVESRAQMNCLPRHQPRCFYDLVVEVALIRPGPIQGGDMVHPYLRRRNGEEPVTYPHPKLEPVLKRTLGVPLFQEQGMRLAVEAAGFTLTEADELRRAMGHKRSHEKMQALSQRLIEGMMRNGIDHQSAMKVFDQLAAFADFGFAESHAASFALLVYVSAWLKLYYPPEFYCSLLNSQPMGFYSPSSVLYEGQRRGVVFEPVDITRSQWDSTITDDFHVLLGFHQVKSLGPAAKEKLERELPRREDLPRRPFQSIADFVYRTGLERDELEQLATVGAFRSFGVSRRQALWEVLALLRRDGDELEIISPDTGEAPLEPMTATETLIADYKGLDLSPQPHLMTHLRASLEREGVVSAAGLRGVRNGGRVTVAGVVIIRQRPVTAKGFLFITLEDETGFANVVVKPPMLKRFRLVIVHSRGLVVRGCLERRDGVYNVIADHFEALTLGGEKIRLKSRDFR